MEEDMQDAEIVLAKLVYINSGGFLIAREAKALQAELARLRAQVTAMQPVVEAASQVRNVADVRALVNEADTAEGILQLEKDLQRAEDFLLSALAAYRQQTQQEPSHAD